MASLRKQKKMEYLVSTDKNYVKYLLVLMASAYQNHPGIKSTFHILHNEQLDNRDKAVIEKFAREYRQEACFYMIDDNLFASFPVGKAWPTSCMYILFTHKLLPESIDRVLYLDIDTIINANLEEFYDLPFDDNYLIASKVSYDVKAEPHADFEKFEYFRDKDDGKASKGGYFNSGILLFNLEKFRKDNIDLRFYIEKMQDADGNFYKDIFYDQGILNLAFADRTKYLTTCKYNYRIAYSLIGYNDRENCCKNIIPAYKFYPVNAKIIHYCGVIGKKPWSIKFKANDLARGKKEFLDYVQEIVAYNDVWWKYAEAVPNYKELLEDACQNKKIYSLMKEVVLDQNLNLANLTGVETLSVPVWRNKNSIVRNEDLNCFVASKVFRCVDAATKTTLKNLPEQFTEKCGFRLTVKNIAAYDGDNTSVIQILEPNDGKATMYRRSGHTGGKGWSKWQKMITEDDLTSRLEEQNQIIKELTEKIDALTAKLDQESREIR